MSPSPPAPIQAGRVSVVRADRRECPWMDGRQDLVGRLNAIRVVGCAYGERDRCRDLEAVAFESLHAEVKVMTEVGPAVGLCRLDGGSQGVAGEGHLLLGDAIRSSWRLGGVCARHEEEARYQRSGHGLLAIFHTYSSHLTNRLACPYRKRRPTEVGRPSPARGGNLAWVVP